MRSILRVIHFKPLMFALLVAVVAFGVTAPIAPAQAVTVVVANTNDSGGGFLRAAITAASSGDTIDLTGLSGTILLTSGQLSSSKNLTHQRTRRGVAEHRRQRQQPHLQRQQWSNRLHLGAHYHEWRRQ